MRDRYNDPFRPPWKKPSLRAHSQPKPASFLHPNKRKRLDRVGIRYLRLAGFLRSEGVFECSGLGCCPGASSCGKPVSWRAGHLHHVIARAQGGDDTLENVRFITVACHMRITGDPQWGDIHKAGS